MQVLLNFDRTRRNMCLPIIIGHLEYVNASISEKCSVLGIDEHAISDSYIAPENPLSYETQLEKLLVNKANAIKVLERLDTDGAE